MDLVGNLENDGILLLITLLVIFDDDLLLAVRIVSMEVEYFKTNVLGAVASFKLRQLGTVL